MSRSPEGVDWLQVQRVICSFLYILSIDAATGEFIPGHFMYAWVPMGKLLVSVDSFPFVLSVESGISGGWRAVTSPAPVL